MSTDISGVTTNFFPVAYGGFVDSLASTASAGATTVALTSTAEYANGDVVVLCVNPGDASLEAFFTGTVNSNSIENVKWVGGPGIAAAHSAGAPVRDYVSAAGQSMMTKGIKVQHKQSGAHSAITADSVASTGAVSGTTVTGSGAGQFAGVTSTTSTAKYRDESSNSVDIDPMRRNEGFQGYDFIQTGLNPSSAAGLVVTIPAGTYYINGKRYTYAGGTKTLTASKDCYLDIDTSGTVTAVEVANGATAGMTLTANSIRFSKIVTGGASVSSYNNGITSLATAFDPLGNRIGRRDPRDNVIGYAELTSVQTGTTLIPFDDTIPQNAEGDQYLTCPVFPKTASSKLKIEIDSHAGSSVATYITAALFRDSGADAIGVTSPYQTTVTSLVDLGLTVDVISGSTSATTFKLRIGGANAGTVTVNGAATARKFGGILITKIRVTEIL